MVGDMPQQMKTAQLDPQAARYLAGLRDALDRPYVFVHINKCGGTSVASALGLMQFHASVQKYITLFGRERFLSRRSFTVVRRPYERLCSLYRYRLKRGKACFEGRELDLNEWVYRALEACDPEVTLSRDMLKPAHDWLVDDQGAQLVELVVRLEEIDAGWPSIQQLTGTDAALPWENTTGTTPDTSAGALNRESRDIIERVFHKDFDSYCYDRIRTRPFAGRLPVRASPQSNLSLAPASGLLYRNPSLGPNPPRIRAE